MRLNEFCEKKPEEAIKYDFLQINKRGNVNEPDNCRIIKNIYNDLFVFYNEKNYSGDTLNTYRTKIRTIYKDAYIKLIPDEKIEIITKVRNHTQAETTHLYTFLIANSIEQISNNYQLGNFMPLPKKRISYTSLNVERSRYPFNDNFDEFLAIIYYWYSNDFFEKMINLSNDLGITLLTNNKKNQEVLDEENNRAIAKDIYTIRKSRNENRGMNDKVTTLILMKVVQANQKDYFSVFNSFDDYITKNYLDSFFVNKDTNYIVNETIQFQGKYLLALSEMDFEVYIKEANCIIEKRGTKMFKALIEHQNN